VPVNIGRRRSETSRVTGYAQRRRPLRQLLESRRVGHQRHRNSANQGIAIMRTASCSCGSLRADTIGEPVRVIACHCRECQRRTGAPFGVTVVFRKAQVQTEGPRTEYVRDAPEGRKVRFHFCPDCGTTLFWYPDTGPDIIGIALGAFADPSFPEPTASAWEEAQHPWVAFRHELNHFPASS
jgi:hypothetical protein